VVASLVDRLRDIGIRSDFARFADDEKELEEEERCSGRRSLIRGAERRKLGKVAERHEKLWEYKRNCCTSSDMNQFEVKFGTDSSESVREMLLQFPSCSAS